MATVTVTASLMTCVRNGYSSTPSLPIQIGGSGGSGDYNNSVYMTFPGFGLPPGSVVNSATLNYTMTGWDYKAAITINTQACGSAGTPANQVACTGTADATAVPASTLVSSYAATNTARQMYSSGAYYLKMYAANGDNRKTFSSTAATLTVDYTAPTAPSPPTGLYISPGVFEGTATLGWSAGAGGYNNPITGYYVQYRINGGGWQYAGTVGGTSLTLNTTGIERGASLTFQVAALSNYADAVWSSVSGAATRNRKPNTPSGAGMSKPFYAPGETLRNNFTNTGDPDGNLAGFEAAPGGSETVLATRAASAATYVDIPGTGWTSGVNYAFRVRGYDALGVRGDWSDTASAMIGLPVFVQPAAGGGFKRVVQMQVYVPGAGFKTVKSMKIAPAQGAISKTVF